MIWGPSILLGTVSAFIFISDFRIENIIAIILLVVWALRLSFHIYQRFIRKDRMDERYIKLLSSKTKSIPGVYVKVFVVQSLLASLVSLAFLPVAYVHLNVWVLTAGSLVWIMGFIFESVADKQLAVHIHTSHGIMKQGLWRYSRHPNYFGEVVQWWGFWTMSIGSWLSLPALIGPITITYLIVFVSGIPMLEKHMANKPGWSEYASKTPALIPSLFFPTFKRR